MAHVAMREKVRLALLRGETLVWHLQNFLVVAHVEARISGLDLGEREVKVTHSSVMLLERCGEPQRQTA